uniref:Uncharacterized protein n=1 Tax=Zea mays TaxID=4577 RepID=B6TSS4_MAIZE|nr:hypothetical protein [Zea mays]
METPVRLCSKKATGVSWTLEFKGRESFVQHVTPYTTPRLIIIWLDKSSRRTNIPWLHALIHQQGTFQPPCAVNHISVASWAAFSPTHHQHHREQLRCCLCGEVQPC